MMKKLFACSLLVIVAGCATSPQPATTPADVERRSDFDKAQDSWHGAPLKELTAKLGKPTTVTRQAGGSTVYAFTKSTRGGTGFACTVRYTVDDKTQRIQGHEIEGC